MGRVLGSACVHGTVGVSVCLKRAVWLSNPNRRCTRASVCTRPVGSACAGHGSHSHPPHRGRRTAWPAASRCATTNTTRWTPASAHAGCSTRPWPPATPWPRWPLHPVLLLLLLLISNLLKRPCMSKILGWMECLDAWECNGVTCRTRFFIFG